jgi:hypothetical protein
VTATARPKTCSEQAAIDPTLGEAGCKRLPRHKGDHRATLHATPVNRTSSKRTTSGRRVSKAGLKRLAVKLAAAVEAGDLAPSLAMSRYAAYVTRLAAKRARRVTTAPEVTAA